MWRRWLYVIITALLVIGIIAGAEILFLASESYPQRQSYSHNQYQPVYASLVQLLLGGWHWLGDYVDHDTITTIAIAATAIFTGTLYRATSQLQQTSRIHAGHMEESVKVAQEAAKAAAAAAGAASEQARIMRNAERPYLIPHESQLLRRQNVTKGVDKVMAIYFDIKNVGNGVAFLDSCGIAHEICRDDKQGGLAVSIASDFARIPISGGSIWLADDLPFRIFSFSEEQKADVSQGRQRLFVYGYLRYSDIFGVFRRTGFMFEGPSSSLEEEDRSYFVMRRDRNWWFDTEEGQESGHSRHI